MTSTKIAERTERTLNRKEGRETGWADTFEVVLNAFAFDL